MSDSELKAQLDIAQEELRLALAQGEFEALPELVEARLPYMLTLSERAPESEELKSWAQAYLERDREILEDAVAAKEAVTEKLHKSRSRRHMRVAYLSAVKN